MLFGMDCKVNQLHEILGHIIIMFRMNKIVECWTNLSENVDTLSSLVYEKQPEALSGCNEISIVKLEAQIKNLKTSFSEKEKLIIDFDSLAPEFKNILKK